MSRRKLVAGNWKLHLGPAASTALAKALRGRLGSTSAEIVVFPTALSTAAVVDTLAGSDIAVGVQWAHSQPQGAFTGCNSAQIAAEVVGPSGWLLAGHSEVRRDLGETDARVRDSVRAGLAAGMQVMMCLGETLAEREAGQLPAVLGRQLEVGLEGLSDDQLSRVVLAYEPVWAIGTGVVATPTQVQEAHAWIRAWLTEHRGPAVAAKLRVLYGGSVKASNAAALMALPDVDGCLVGGAALQADEFAGIVEGAS